MYAYVLIAISQSGETADTLCAVQAAQQKGVIIASVVNMPGALLSRLSDFDFYSRSGPEMCVLSTKSGTAQLAFGYLLAQHLLMQTSAAPKSQTDKNISEHNLVQTEFKKDFTDDNKNTVPALRNTAHTNIDALIPALSQFFKPENLQDYVDLAQQIKGEHLFLLGHGKFLATAKIGALNIKEASYIHAEAFSAGELKHGVIALIEAGTPVICFVDEDNHDYMIGVVAQLKARGAWVIGISHQANAVFDETLFFPCKSQDADIISHIIPCQILAYYLALARGVNPDRPRNLAKSVTVF